jgi:hypothetical protein
VRGLRGHYGISKAVVVSLEAFAFGAKRETSRAFPPWRAEPAALAEPQLAQEFFRVHRILIPSLDAGGQHSASTFLFHHRVRFDAKPRSGPHELAGGLVAPKLAGGGGGAGGLLVPPPGPV